MKKIFILALFITKIALAQDVGYIYCIPDVDAPAWADGQYYLLIKQSGDKFFGIREKTKWYGKSYYSEVFELDAYGSYYLVNKEEKVTIEFKISGDYGIELTDLSGRICERGTNFEDISILFDSDKEELSKIENY